MFEHAMTARAFGLPGAAAMLALAAMPAAADPFFFSTGDTDGRMAAASRPDTSPFEIETADDFVLSQSTTLTGATFVGLIPAGAFVERVTIEIYRVFPNDSDVGRTSGPPVFSTPNVPTRVNSPSDVALDARDSSGGTLNFSTTNLGGFTVDNTVQPGGISPSPGQTTGGNGSVTGEEVEFSVDFLTALSLDPDHYFFVPQVQLDTGDFLWLSAPRPIFPPGTPFPGGSTDLQGWTRDQFLDPDWLRVGTDIVGAGAFNFTFSLTGDTSVPEPASLLLFGSALAGLGWVRRRR